MSSLRPHSVLDADGHPACQAWREVTPHSPPPFCVEDVQRRKRSQVYRLQWRDGNGSVIAKRCRKYMTVVERATYGSLLPTARVRAPAYYGYLDDASSDPDDPFAWLFIEDMGHRRFSPGDAGQRVRLARWLGCLQATFLRPEAHQWHSLPVRDAVYYQRYLHQAIRELPALAAERSFSGSLLALIRTVVAELAAMQRRWDTVTASFADVPMTLVHGDCLPKNIHVAHDPGGGYEVVPIDWGNAGWGLPGSDLGHSTLLLRDDIIGEASYDEYAAALRPAWPDCSTAVVQQLANLGRLLWSIKVIAMSAKAFQYDNPVKVERVLSTYASLLFTSLALTRWAETN